MIYLHLIYFPLKFTSILFQKIRRCAPHIETCQRPPTLTLGSTFHIQYRHIPITPQDFFTLNNPFRPFSSIGSTFRSQHRRIQTQVNKTPVLHNQALLKKARGVCRGAAALRPLCGFPFFLKKILHAIRQKSKRHTVFKKKVFLTSCSFT